jgi:integrase
MAGLQGIKGLYEKRGWFYFQPPTAADGSGRPRPVALKTRDLVEALQRMEASAMEITLDRALLSGTLKEVLPRYFQAKGGDAVSTRRARKVILEAFMNDMGNPKAAAITAALVEEWRELLARPEGRAGSGKPLSGTTIKSYTITLRAFVNWLREERILKHDPMAKLKRQTRVAATRRHEFLTEAQRERALADEKADDNVRLILHLGFFAGLRDAEMLAMTPAWIWIAPDQRRGTITVQQTVVLHADGKNGLWRPKTRQMRTIPMHPRLLEFIKGMGLRWPFMVAPEKDKWPGEEKNSKRYDAKKALAGVAKRQTIPKLNFHMLRHSFATHLAMKGVPLAGIAGLLGDSLKVTEDHYAGYCPSQVNPLEVL